MKALMMALILVASPVWAQSSDSWETTRKGGGRGEVSTYARKVAESPVKAFKGVVELQASPAAVLAVITAVDTFPEWIFQNRDAERLTADHKERILMSFKGIWPVSDRDVVLANELSQDKASGVITLHSVNAEGYLAKRDGYVRIPALDNQFTIAPLADGWVRVQFETFVDPGGSVPVWLANLVATRAPLETLEGIKEQLKKPRFANATREDLPKLPGMDQLEL